MHNSDKLFPTTFLVVLRFLKWNEHLEILNPLRVSSSLCLQMVSSCFPVELAKHFREQPLVADVALNESSDTRYLWF